MAKSPKRLCSSPCASQPLRGQREPAALVGDAFHRLQLLHPARTPVDHFLPFSASAQSLMQTFCLLPRHRLKCFRSPLLRGVSGQSRKLSKNSGGVNQPGKKKYIPTSPSERPLGSPRRGWVVRLFPGCGSCSGRSRSVAGMCYKTFTS